MDKKVELTVYLSLILGNMGYIILDLPFRSIVSLSIFLFLPGYLFLKVINLELQRKWTEFTLSIAFSLTFLMGFGFLFNHLFYSLGITNPLEYLYLPYSIILVVFCAIIFFYRYSDLKHFSFQKQIFSSTNLTEGFIIILSLFLITLSIFSVNYVNMYDQVAYVALTYLAISVSFFIVWASRNRINERIYPFVILAFSLSITILLTFRSSYFYGNDIYHSYYLSGNVLERSHWSILQEGTLFSSLAETFLPPVVSIFAGLRLLLVFKILITIVVSMIPVILYLVLRELLTPIQSFIGSIFYISSMFFVTAGGGLRTQLAFLFVAVFLFIICGSIKNHSKKYFLAAIAIFSIIISHYATTYAFGILLFFTFIWILFRKITIKEPLSYSIHAKLVATYLLFVYLWNSYIVYPFESAVDVIERSLMGFFYGVDEHTYREAAMGEGARGDIFDYYLSIQIEWVLMWLLIGCIAIGALYVMFKGFNFDKLFSSDKEKNKNTILGLENYIDSDYFALSIGGFFVAALLFLPGIDPGMGISRSWGLLTLFFPPLFLIGINFLFKNTDKKQLLVIVILAVYFISVTGASHYIYDQIEEDPQDIEMFKGRILNTRNESRGKSYEIYEEEVYASEWLVVHADREKDLYTDSHVRRASLLPSRIRLGGPFGEENHTHYYENLRSFANYTIENFENSEGYIYLRYVNVEHLEYKTTHKHHFENFESVYEDLTDSPNFNMVYTNGGSEIIVSP